jgi:hypothetical protein
MESIPPAYVAWRVGIRYPIPTLFLTPIDCLKIPAQDEKHRIAHQSGHSSQKGGGGPSEKGLLNKPKITV